MQSDGFIREVDEELQRERVARLWQRYGTIVVGAAVIVIAGTAGKVGWDAWQERQLTRQGAAFAAAETAFRANPADAAGLPILPGLVRYDEVHERGEITHALRFTVSRTRRDGAALWR